MASTYFGRSLKRKLQYTKTTDLHGAHLESLEHRLLFAAAITNGSLVVDGTGNSDSIAISTVTDQIVVDLNGQQSQFNLVDVDSIVVNGQNSPDTINVSVNRPTTVNGGNGDDTINTGAGADTFNWNPGDGSDTIDAFGGTDTLVFNGASVNENFDLSSFGTFLRLSRDVSGAVMAVHGVENVTINALGGLDNVVVNDLSLTDVKDVSVNLASPSGGPDVQNDVVTVNGGSNADLAHISESGGDLTVAETSTSIHVIKPDIPNDRLIVNGAGGNDTAIFDAGSADDSISVVPNGGSVRISRAIPMAAIDIGSTENLTINGMGGNDTLTGSNGLATLTTLTFDGGAGNDSITGGDGADQLIGGDGNDFIEGNVGADNILLGNNDDTFNWDPGDGSDIVEGQAGNDTMIFNGANTAEAFDLSAQAGRFRLSRDVASIVMDTNGLENVVLSTLGAADSINIQNLAGTSVSNINLRLSAAGGGGDKVADTITLNGTELANAVAVSGVEGLVTVTGLPATVSIEGIDTTLDILTVNLAGGNDSLSAANLDLATLSHFTADGGADNDSLIGSPGADVLTGGTGNDTIDANAGFDTVDLGADTDTFVWNPGDGGDIVSGGTGQDTLIFNGSSAAESVAISPKVPRVDLTRNIGGVDLNLGDLETIRFNAMGGADLVTVNDLTGTGTSLVDVDLAGALGGSTGDGQLDQVTVNGSGGADNVQVTGAAGTLNFTGSATTVQLDHYESASDSITYVGQAGADVLTLNGLAAAEATDVSANGAKVRLSRDVDALRFDIDDVETLKLKTSAGVDSATVNSLAGTDVTAVSVDLANDGTASPDGQNDTVIVNATSNGTNQTAMDLAGGGTQVTGLTYVLTVLNADAGDKLHFNLLEGIDTLTVTQTGSVGGIRRIEVDGGSETDTINVLRTAADGVVVVEPSTGGDNVNANASNLGAANMLFESSAMIGSLNVGSGGIVKIAPGGGKVLTVNNINFSPGGKLDITDNALINDYLGLTPISTILLQLTNGYNNGAWNGNGIISSTAAAQPNTGIGYAEASTLFGSFPATFKGQSVDNTSIVMTYALSGDANLDGKVNTLDFTALSQQFGQTARRWNQGDFNYNNNVNALDFNAIATNFGKVIQPSVPANLEAASSEETGLFGKKRIAVDDERIL